MRLPSSSRTRLAFLSAVFAFAACSKAPPAPTEGTPPVEAVPAAPTSLTFEARSRQGSMLAVTRLKLPNAADLALVADDEDQAVVLLDAKTGAVLGRQKLSGRPGQILVLENGLLAVASRDEAKVLVFSIASPTATTAIGADVAALGLREEYTLYTASEPIALATSAESQGPRQLFVVTGLGRTLEQFDLATKKKKFIFDIAQEPRAVVALEDGTLVVTHANAGVLTKIKGKDVTALRLDEGEMFSRQGFSLTALGRDAFIPDTFVMPEDASGSMRGVASGYGGGTVCEQDGWHKGWVVDPHPGHAPNAKAPAASAQASATAPGAFAQFNVRRPSPAIRSFDCVQVMSTAGTLRRIGPKTDGSTRALVTQLGTKCILPRAAVAHEGKREVYVACLGTNRVEAIQLGSDKEDGDPSIPPRMSRGWTVPKGPLGLALLGDTLFAWSQFAHRLTRIDLNASELSSVDVARDVPIAANVALGRELFHAAGDTRIAQDGRACASCHPDGLSDGIGWATPDGRRKPMILAGRIGAGPFGWRGEHKTLHEHVAKTIFSHLHGTGLSTEAMDALEAYVKVIPAPRSKAPASDETRHGKDLFSRGDTGCARCHNPDTNFSDGAPHDVGTGGKFRTPPLKFATAALPYMHEGKYAKLDDFLRATDGKMGNTKQLTDQEFKDLVSYVQSL